MTTTRMIHIAIGYIVACVGAVLGCMLIFFPVLGLLFSSPRGALVVLAIMAVVMVLALVPSLIAIVFAERYRIRSRAAHVAIGAVIGAVTILLFVLLDSARSGISPSPDQLPGLCLFGCLPGAVGGLAYHAIAGQDAGE